MTEQVGAWQKAPLRDVVSKIVDGSHNPPPKQESGLPMLSARNIENGKIVFDEFRYIEESAFHQENCRTRVSADDVLLTIVGSIGRAAVVSKADTPFALQRSVAVLSPKAELLSKFLCYQLQAPSVQRYFKENARGTAQKGVYLKTLGLTPIVVPPLAAQANVVSEIEKQFSRLDEAVANLRRVKANLKRHRVSLLNAAVEGRLVETEHAITRREGRSYETGEQLLHRMLGERRAKRVIGKKYIEPDPPGKSVASNLPLGWTTATVEQISDVVEYGSSSKTSDDSGGIAVLRMGNIFDGELRFDELKYLPRDHSEFPRLLLLDGDLLFNRTNSPELVGKVAVYRAKGMKHSFASYLIRVRLLSGAVPEFLAAYINSSFGRQWIKGVVTQQVGQANVNGTKLQELAVPVPPLNEQRRIVDELGRRLSIAREVEAEVAANLKRAQALRQTILAKAFGG